MDCGFQTDVWFQWYLVQAKIIEPIRIHEYLFLEDASEPLMFLKLQRRKQKFLPNTTKC